MTDKDNFKGYRGKAVYLLKKFDAFVWSDVEIETVEGKGIAYIHYIKQMDESRIWRAA